MTINLWTLPATLFIIRYISSDTICLVQCRRRQWCRTRRLWRCINDVAFVASGGRINKAGHSRSRNVMCSTGWGYQVLEKWVTTFTSCTTDWRNTTRNWYPWLNHHEVDDCDGSGVLVDRKYPPHVVLRFGITSVIRLKSRSVICCLNIYFLFF